MSLSKNAFGSKLTYDALYNRYVDYYKSKYFPNLLKNGDGTIPELDKSIIRDMLLKPWALYNMRHSSLTEKSLILREPVLRDHAGWTMSSKMPQIYIHYLGNQSCRMILTEMGIIRESKTNKSYALNIRQCPNCCESNKPDSKFCVKCRMVLSYDGYNEIIQEKEQKQSELKILTEKYEKDMKELREHTDKKLDRILSLIQENPKLANVKTNVISRF